MSACVDQDVVPATDTTAGPYRSRTQPSLERRYPCAASVLYSGAVAAVRSPQPGRVKDTGDASQD